MSIKLKSVYYRRLQVLLISISFIFLVHLGYNLTRPITLEIESSFASEIPAPLPVLATSSPTPVGQYKELVDRPLFVESRKPYTPPVSIQTVKVEVQEPQYDNNNYLLTGIVMSGNQKVALIQKENGDVTERLKPGQSIDGWTLSEFSASSIVLNRGGQTKRLELMVNTTTNQSPTSRRPRRVSREMPPVSDGTPSEGKATQPN